VTTDQSHEEEQAKATAMNSAKAKSAETNDMENICKWHKILRKNKSEMSEEERQDHETHCTLLEKTS
jgi:hypothetical protein